MKALTIPRLELMFALLLVGLMNTVRSVLSVDVELSHTYYSHDSKTALCWINNQGEWKQFVRHTVNEILKLSDKEEWGDCPWEENPTDLGSRRVSPSRLKECNLWWKGTTWLLGPKVNWPIEVEIVDKEYSLKEFKKSVTMAVQVEKDSADIEHVINVKADSYLNRLIRLQLRY